MWVLPPGIYLLTFILCFEGRGGTGGLFIYNCWRLALGAWLTLKVFDTRALVRVKVLVLPLFAAGLFTAAWCVPRGTRRGSSPTALPHALYLMMVVRRRAGWEAGGGGLQTQGQRIVRDAAGIAACAFGGWWDAEAGPEMDGSAATAAR